MMKIFDMQTSANIPAHKTENKHRKEKISNCYLHSNSLSNKMDNSLLAVRDINHKYIVVEKGEQKYVGENQGNRSRSVRN